MLVWKGSDVAGLMMGGLLVALTALTIHFCALGHNWARIVLAILGALSLLQVGLFVFRLASAIGQGKQIETGQIIQPLAVAITTIAASALLFIGPANGWFRGVRSHTVARPSWKPVTLATAAVFLGAMTVGAIQHHRRANGTLPSEIVVDVRNQLAEIRTDSARIDDLIAKLDAQTALMGGSKVPNNVDPLKRGILMSRSMLRERGTTIYRDVRNRYPQLSEQQRVAVASMIGNALRMNAKYYLLSDSVSEERGGIVENPGFGLDDTSQNLPDPE